MARGTIAKEEVTKKIKSCFGEDFIGEVDKKLYLWANDGGERIQVAITLTCPKVQVETGKTSSAAAFSQDFNFEDNAATPSKPAVPANEITSKERETINELLLKLGL